MGRGINIGGFFDWRQFLVDSRRVYNRLLITPSSPFRGDTLLGREIIDEPPPMKNPLVTTDVKSTNRGGYLIAHIKLCSCNTIILL